MDLKNAMQAISNGGSQAMAQLLLKAMKEKAIADKEHREWQGWAAGSVGAPRLGLGCWV
jgi:hypothetical protein